MEGKGLGLYEKYAKLADEAGPLLRGFWNTKALQEVENVDQIEKKELLSQREKTIHEWSSCISKGISSSFFEVVSPSNEKLFKLDELLGDDKTIRWDFLAHVKELIFEPNEEEEAKFKKYRKRIETVSFILFF
jgi:hypothetical protein